MWISIVKFWNFVLDIIFPRRCLACGREGTYCCSRCINVIEKRRNPQVTLPNTELDLLLAAFTYGERTFLARLIHQFKYRFSSELAELFVEYIGPVLSVYFQPSEIVLVPVPLHKKRKNFRGFNQSELLCEKLTEYGYHWVSALQRSKNTPPQARLSRIERLSNLDNAFVIVPEFLSNIRHKTVVLVDDIATTGATLNECARVLRQAGCPRVCGLTIAHGGDAKR